MKYTITAFSENKPGVLYRLSGLLLKRKINVESMTVSETEQKGFSRFTIVINTDQSTIEKVTKQIYRIIEVTKVYESIDQDLLFKEIAFFKVNIASAQKRREIKEIVSLSKGKVLKVYKNTIVIEKTGSEEEINDLFSILTSYGIKEFIRSGRIALMKEKR